MLCLFWEHLLQKLEPKISCFFIFIDLEKGFWLVAPREVVRFALRWKGVPEYLLKEVTSLYKGCKTAVSVGNYRVYFLWKMMPIRVCSESIFIYHSNGCSDEDVRDGSSMELLNADDLVLSGKSLNEVMDKY